MNFGITGNLRGYGLSEQYKKSIRTEKSESASFAEVVAAKAKEQDNVSEISFKDMWQARFPGAYYHTMDAYNISQGLWERNDFPFEKFFSDKPDESVLNWTPNGENPAMDSDGVQS
ncbi:MAG: hypothetical protein K2J11_11410, partial [Oscillospiraceae bacterium]|nr:hypothetical protein [Oscillospiraceae bacterium]